MIILEIWLHGKPEWELPLEGNRINPFIIENYGNFIKNHMHNVAFTIKKLQNNGWILNEDRISPYSIEYFKEGVDSNNVYNELKNIGIESSDVAIRELVENE